MKTQDYHTSISAKVSAEEAIKKINQVNLWWAKNFKGKAEKLNDSFTVQFGKAFVDFKISELVPGKKVVWKVTDCNLEWINNKKEWNGTDVVFELTKKGNLTQIDFTHIGLIPGVECYNDCETGWNGHLKNSLKELLTTGKGSPE
ncbi:MAG TPA: SRPBCC domain-containing protein [Bacteroidia bacterium]|nr:SRPBCC domain-containing protein [Bacteroidia bacterium]